MNGEGMNSNNANSEKPRILIAGADTPIAELKKVAVDTAPKSEWQRDLPHNFREARQVLVANYTRVEGLQGEEKRRFEAALKIKSDAEVWLQGQEHYKLQMGQIEGFMQKLLTDDDYYVSVQAGSGMKRQNAMTVVVEELGRIRAQSENEPEWAKGVTNDSIDQVTTKWMLAYNRAKDINHVGDYKPIIAELKARDECMGRFLESPRRQMMIDMLVQRSLAWEEASGLAVRKQMVQTGTPGGGGTGDENSDRFLRSMSEITGEESKRLDVGSPDEVKDMFQEWVLDLENPDVAEATEKKIRYALKKVKRPDLAAEKEELGDLFRLNKFCNVMDVHQANGSEDSAKLLGETDQKEMLFVGGAGMKRLERLLTDVLKPEMVDVKVVLKGDLIVLEGAGYNAYKKYLTAKTPGEFNDAEIGIAKALGVVGETDNQMTKEQLLRVKKVLWVNKAIGREALTDAWGKPEFKKAKIESGGGIFGGPKIVKEVEVAVPGEDKFGWRGENSKNWLAGDMNLGRFLVKKYGLGERDRGFYSALTTDFVSWLTKPDHLRDGVAKNGIHVLRLGDVKWQLEDNRISLQKTFGVGMAVMADWEEHLKFGAVTGKALNMWRQGHSWENFKEIFQKGFLGTKGFDNETVLREDGKLETIPSPSADLQMKLFEETLRVYKEATPFAAQGDGLKKILDQILPPSDVGREKGELITKMRDKAGVGLGARLGETLVATAQTIGKASKIK